MASAAVPSRQPLPASMVLEVASLAVPPDATAASSSGRYSDIEFSSAHCADKEWEEIQAQCKILDASQLWIADMSLSSPRGHGSTHVEYELGVQPTPSSRKDRAGSRPQERAPRFRVVVGASQEERGVRNGASRVQHVDADPGLVAAVPIHKVVPSAAHSDEFALDESGAGSLQHRFLRQSLQVSFSDQSVGHPAMGSDRWSLCSPSAMSTPQWDHQVREGAPAARPQHQLQEYVVDLPGEPHQAVCGVQGGAGVDPGGARAWHADWSGNNSGSYHRSFYYSGDADQDEMRHPAASGRHRAAPTGPSAAPGLQVFPPLEVELVDGALESEPAEDDALPCWALPMSNSFAPYGSRTQASPRVPYSSLGPKRWQPEEFLPFQPAAPTGQSRPSVPSGAGGREPTPQPRTDRVLCSSQPPRGLRALDCAKDFEAHSLAATRSVDLSLVHPSTKFGPWSPNFPSSVSEGGQFPSASSPGAESASKSPAVLSPNGDVRKFIQLPNGDVKKSVPSPSGDAVKFVTISPRAAWSTVVPSLSSKIQRQASVAGSTILEEEEMDEEEPPVVSALKRRQTHSGTMALDNAPAPAQNAPPPLMSNPETPLGKAQAARAVPLGTVPILEPNGSQGGAQAVKSVPVTSQWMLAFGGGRGLQEPKLSPVADRYLSRQGRLLMKGSPGRLPGPAEGALGLRRSSSAYSLDEHDGDEKSEAGEGLEFKRSVTSTARSQVAAADQSSLHGKARSVAGGMSERAQQLQLSDSLSESAVQLVRRPVYIGMGMAGRGSAAPGLNADKERAADAGARGNAVAPQSRGLMKTAERPAGAASDKCQPGFLHVASNGVFKSAWPVSPAYGAEKGNN